LLEKIRDARAQVTFGGRYVHYKKPDDYYIVQGFAIIESTGSAGVIYQAQFGERLTFIRPLSSWLAEVESHGKKVARFSEVTVNEDGEISG